MNGRVARVTVHREAVTHSIDSTMTWDSSEAKHRELHVSVVWCHHLTHIEQSAFVLIVLIESVQTV